MNENLPCHGEEPMSDLKNKLFRIFFIYWCTNINIAGCEGVAVLDKQ